MEIDKNLVLGILVVAFLAVVAYAFVNTEKATISVTGSSEINNMPDFVSLYLNIETLNNSAEVSKNLNAEITEKVIAELKKLNFKDDEIETLSWNIYEDYSWEENTRKSKGYKTSNRIKITVEEYDFVATVVDKVVDAGALIDSIQFEITKEHENELKSTALEKATQDAKEKAEAIASGSGQRLGKLVSVTTNDYYYRPYLWYESTVGGDVSEAKQAVTQISPREITVYGNVQAIYRLGFF